MTMASKEDRFDYIVDEDGKALINLKGDWTEGIGDGIILKDVKKLSSVTVDGTNMGKWGTPLMILLYRLNRECQAASIPLNLANLPKGASRLLELSRSSGRKQFHHESLGFFERLDSFCMDFFSSCGDGLQFVGEICVALLRLVTGRARMRWCDVWTEIIKAGPHAFFIVSLIGYLMGLILAFIGAIPLKWVRAEIYVASLIGIGMMRLMGAVMTGTVMAGRTGAAYAAELGTMQVNEEIDALESMGISPMDFLVLPRFIALTLMLPLLCIYADVMGILGGLTVGVFYLNLTVTAFWQQLISTSRLADLAIGIFTSFVFAILISLCGCLKGVNCGRSSASVGQATTAAMVSSLVCLVVATSIITVITVSLGI